MTHWTSSLPSYVGHKVYSDKYISYVTLVQCLKNDGISVGTTRDDRLKGAEKVVQDKTSLETRGRGSSDWCLDTNTNITLVRRSDNGVVHLISTYTLKC